MTAYITRHTTTDTEDTAFVKYLCGHLPATAFLGTKAVESTGPGGTTEVVLYTRTEEGLRTLTIALGFENPAELMSIEELEV